MREQEAGDWADHLLERGEPVDLSARPAIWRMDRDYDGREDARDTAVIRCGTPQHPYYWVICPASATLVLSSDPTAGSGCSLGIECDWDRAHLWAAGVIKSLEGKPWLS